VEAPAPGWGAAVEPDEDTQPEALTMVEPSDDEAVDDGEPAPDPWEEGLVAHGVEPEPDDAERSGFFRRRRR
jgi:hypothetical protein